MMQCPTDRVARLLLASAVAAGLAFTAGCRKEPTASSTPPPLAIGGDSGSASSLATARAPTTAGKAAGRPDSSPALPVTADQLARDFQSDEKAAAGKYRDRWLVVDGVYKEAYEKKAEGGETRMVYFADYSNPETRHTSFVGCKVAAASYPAFDGLTPGQKIKVRARCTAGAYSSVSLADGELLEAGPDPAVRLPAAQLAREVAADGKAAAARYNDRWLLVEGTVWQTSTKDRPAITLEGADEKAAKPFRVTALFKGDRETEPAKVKKGDKVKLKGRAALYLDDGSAVLDDCKLVK